MRTQQEDTTIHLGNTPDRMLNNLYTTTISQSLIATPSAGLLQTAIPH